MTAPAYQQSDQQDDHSAEEAAVIAAIALWLASQLAIKAVLLPRRLVGMFGPLGISSRAARAAGKMALSVPLTGRSRNGSPGLPDAATRAWPGTGATPSMVRRVAAEEPTMRARYIVNAARRLTQSLLDGEFVDGLKTERRNLVQHVRAGRKRSAAAQALDEVAARAPAGLLRWKTVMDRNTTPDCAALNGALFTLDNPPGIPGGEHVHCRCKAVPALTSSPFGV